MKGEALVAIQLGANLGVLVSSVIVEDYGFEDDVVGNRPDRPHLLNPLARLSLLHRSRF
jgi:hypothetical protein